MQAKEMVKQEITNDRAKNLKRPDGNGPEVNITIGKTRIENFWDSLSHPFSTLEAYNMPTKYAANKLMNNQARRLLAIIFSLAE